jgi:Fe(3+) dicitrate transport protein
MGASYALNKLDELYCNISQNYRAINFSDIRIINPNERIDPNLKDERGFNADLGLRRKAKSWLSYDLSTFFLYYANRIGQIYKTGEAPIFLPYRYRTNVGASTSMGREAFGEAELLHFILPKSKLKVLIYGNGTVLRGVYTTSHYEAIAGKYTEYTPQITMRTGLTLKYQQWTLAYQHTYVGQQFTDATNARYDASAVIGEIPAYQVADLSARMQYKWLGVEAGCNNLYDVAYFTQRAAGYAGPGIIPSLPRNYYLCLEVKVGKNRTH